MEPAGIAIAIMKVALAKLGSIKAWSLLPFIGGVAVTLGLSNLGGSKNSQHVYELRMYHVNGGKMEALIARFGDHTDAIFRRHNMKSIGFWRPQDEPYSQNLFVYILEHPSREEAKTNWAAFQADPEWKKVKADSETDGPLANHIDSYFMDPTSFSVLK
jgi:NIPSNAP